MVCADGGGGGSGDSFSGDGVGCDGFGDGFNGCSVSAAGVLLKEIAYFNLPSPLL